MWHSLHKTSAKVKSESSSLRKLEITAETDDDTSMRTPEPFLMVVFAIEI
jgi:hypothetical protein